MKLIVIGIFKLVFFIFMTNFVNVNAHNFSNGGCNNHCEKRFKLIQKGNQVFNKKEQNYYEDKYSCLKKSLCRG